MSRSTYSTTNEVPSTNELRYHQTLMTNNRANETIPIVVPSSTIKSTTTAINRNNPKVKRFLRDKRRPTGIRPTDVSLASTSTEGSENEDDASTHTTESNESFDLNRTLTSSKPVFTVNRLQSSFENVSITRADPSPSNRTFRPDEFRLHLMEKSTPDDDSSTIKFRQLEDRVLALESLVHEKDNQIHDLQHRLDHLTQDFQDAEEQIYQLRQEKSVLIKAFATVQDSKPPSSEQSKRSNFLPRD